MHPERRRRAQGPDTQETPVDASELIAAYADDLTVDELAEQVISQLHPTSVPSWIGLSPQAEPMMGSVKVWPVRPGRRLHLVGTGPVADRLRDWIARGRVPGWSLQPVRPSSTPLEALFEPLRQACGNRRLYPPLERLGFITVEEVEASPNEALLRITGVGQGSIHPIRRAVAAVFDSEDNTTVDS